MFAKSFPKAMKKRFIISGGGTGGHIFPALAIANQIKKIVPDADILFIGAKNKMEMIRVPQAGYPIEGLDIYGINRSLSLSAFISNLKLPFLLLKTWRKVKKIIKQFNPDAVIGVGGFASGPALRAAASLGIKTLIQEQNSYPGITNKLLSKKANKICVAYDGLEKFFPKEKIIKTGNPVRSAIVSLKKKSEEAYHFFGFQKEKKTVLIVGGSLGARSLNLCLAQHLTILKKEGVQILWQTGELFYKNIDPEILNQEDENTKIVPFIQQIDFAYSIADYIVSRAGALAITELAIVGTPAILVPFPYAAEDHQTANAKALSSQQAAILIPDNEVNEKLIPELIALIHDDEKSKILAQNIKKFEVTDAVETIVNEIFSL